MKKKLCGLLVLCAGMAVAAEGVGVGPGQQPVRPPRPAVVENGAPELPTDALKALGDKFKIENATERCSTPGAAGQQDLFWELVALLEKDEKSRTDDDVGKALDYLLFKANLVTDPTTAEAATRKLPQLHDAIGARLFDQKLKTWISSVNISNNGLEPWSWPEFPDLDKKALNKAVHRMIETGPKHNPVSKLWMAAALLAVDDPEGMKEVTAAKAALEKSIPGQAANAYYRMANNLAENGVRAALPLLLQQAEQELADAAPENRRFSNAFSRLYQLLGWPTNNPQDSKQDLPRVKEWLEKNTASLKWEKARRRYVSDAPPPGMETLFNAAMAVEKSQGIKCMDLLLQGGGQETLLQELFRAIDKKPEAAKDPNMGELLLAVFSQANRQYLREDLMGSFSKVAAANPELGAKLWAQFIRQSFVQNPVYGPSNLVRQMSRTDVAIINQAYSILAGEYQKNFEAAQKTDTPDQLLTIQMQLIFCGGKFDKKLLTDLLAKAGAEWLSRGNSKLNQWSNAMIRSGRTAGLRLMLLEAERDLANDQKEGRDLQPLRNFQYQAGWGEDIERSTLPFSEQIARAEDWLNRNETKLKLDENNSRFSGALSPEKEQLCVALEPFEKKYKFAVGDLNNGNARSNARTLFNSLMQLLQSNADAAKEEGAGAAIAALMDMGQIANDQSMLQRALLELPKVSPQAGTLVWSRYIRKQIDEGLRNNSVYVLSNLDRRYAGAVPEAVAQAKKALAPELLKTWQNSAKDLPLPRLVKCMAAVYAGADVSTEDIGKVLKDLEDIGDENRQAVPEIAEQFVRSQNVKGLTILLLAAETLPNQKAQYIARFEQLINVGPGTGQQQLFQMDQDQLTKRIEYYLGYLKDNAAKLTFDPKTKTYKATVPPTPPAQAPAVEKGDF